MTFKWIRMQRECGGKQRECGGKQRECGGKQRECGGKQRECGGLSTLVLDHYRQPLNGIAWMTARRLQMSQSLTLDFK
jgi:hypothetical protein